MSRRVTMFVGVIEKVQVFGNFLTSQIECDNSCSTLLGQKRLMVAEF